MKNLFMTLAVAGTMLLSPDIAMAQSITQVPLKASYNRPARDWEREALPLGNGHIGAMVFGDVFNEVIQTNEKTLWSGGPGEDVNYNGGHLHTPESAKAALQGMRKDLQKDMIEFTNSKVPGSLNNYPATEKYYNEGGPTPDYTGGQLYMNSMLGTKDHFGSYQTIGNIHIDEAGFPRALNNTIKATVNNNANPITNAFDGDPTTEWYVTKTDWDGKSSVVVSWEIDIPTDVTGYVLTCGNQKHFNQPKQWKFYGSKDGVKYDLLDDHSTATTMEWETSDRNVSKTFTLSATAKGYKYFRYELIACRSKYPTGQPNLAEISLLMGDTSFSNYQRVMDVDNALQTVSYTTGGVNYTREYFISYPDNVMVIRMKADAPFSRRISIECPHTDYNIKVNGENQLELTGWPSAQSESGVNRRDNPDWKNWLRFAQVVGVMPVSEGSIVAGDDGKSIYAENVKEVVIVMSAATNYKPSYDATFNYIDKNADPLQKAKGLVDAAITKGYDAVRDAHLADYHKLYNANKIQLGNITAPSVDTETLLKNYKAGTASANDQRYLETLYYQYGRYLLIACSRPGTLPANLQGIWSDKVMSKWNSDYHTNINIQMNYWPAEVTNLSECHEPMIDLIRQLAPHGALTAQHYHCTQDGKPVRGWTCYHEVNAWGNTGPAARGPYSYAPEGAIWLCQDIWERYLYTQDKQFLADNFKEMLDASLFWVDNLWTDERDGTLVTNPSFSPEHGTFSMGTTFSQGLIYEMFNATVKSAEILGRAEESEVKEVATALSKLSLPKIGTFGQFQEWKDEIGIDVTGEGHWNKDTQRFEGTHRHANHLFWLHPGSTVVPGRSEMEDKAAEAMKQTLITRGDEGTGWSRAWKVNFWSRLRDGNHAHNILKGCLNYAENDEAGVYMNLFDVHPPFQIDGNFGATSGIAEMFLQTQGGAIEIAPALPDAYADGGFTGLRARGGYEVSASWKDGDVQTVTIVKDKGESAKDVHIKFRGAASCQNSEIKERIGDNEIVVDMNMGTTLTLNPTEWPAKEVITTPERPQPKVELEVPGTIIAGLFDTDKPKTYNHSWANRDDNRVSSYLYNLDAEADISADGHVGFTTTDDYFTYTFNCKNSGIYEITLNATAENGWKNCKVKFEIDGKLANEFTFDGKGWNGSTDMVTTKGANTVELIEGEHKLKVTLTGMSPDLYNYVFTKVGDLAGISSVVGDASDAAVYAGRGYVRIINYAGNVQIYNIGGAQVYSAPVAPEHINLVAGTYMVKLGKTTFKVIVR